ncbi:PREDICTED: uncharacterized protein LOC106814090 [Priapulus caudatus]|uniref:Uncharacterized protein LOC106814090 n=1 Tax=Priapulus caudatus TaxID=37621 RepID=A0ABM1ENT1_PRICU|nr:PREDICTED: uncharacterized protein LOC106814090 [Priapulus caudatus]
MIRRAGCAKEDGVVVDSQNHKLGHAVDYPAMGCSQTTCRCDTAVKYECGSGMTIIGTATAICNCDSGSGRWINRPNCRGCHKIDQSRSDDTRVLTYPLAPACNEIHCACGTNVTVRCDSKTRKLSGSRWMVCRCADTTLDAYWEHENGTDARCIADGSNNNDNDSKNDGGGGIKGTTLAILLSLTGIVVVALAAVIAFKLFYVNGNNSAPSTPAPLPPLSPDAYGKMDAFPYYESVDNYEVPMSTLSKPRGDGKGSGSSHSVLGRERMPLPGTKQTTDTHDYFTLESNDQPNPVNDEYNITNVATATTDAEEENPVKSIL